MDRIHVDRDLHDSHDLEDATNVVRWTAIVCDLVRLCLEHESDRIDAMSAHVRSSECLGHHRLEETIMKYTDTQLKLTDAICERDSYREQLEDYRRRFDTQMCRCDSYSNRTIDMDLLKKVFKSCKASLGKQLAVQKKKLW